VESETARAIDRILSTQFVDEPEIAHQIGDDRPRVVAHLAVIRAYVPRTDAVRRIHAAYIDAWQELLDGYDAIEKGFSSRDYTLLGRGRDAMLKWRQQIMQVAGQLRDLMGQLGIDPAAAAGA
jgi:hypothetical protein